MAVFPKILAMLRGNLRELGQSVVDHNATTIYEQEIVEAKNHVASAKQNLTSVMAKEMQTNREIARLQEELTRFEGLALQALQKNENTLAEEVAVKLAEIETNLAEQRASSTEFAGHISRLKDLIRNAESTLREHERQLAMAKTTESVYRATSTISQNMGASGSKLMSAKESLERIKQRHQETADRMQAAEVLEGEFGHRLLEDKLAAAGIGAKANRQTQIMARLKARIHEAEASPDTSLTLPFVAPKAD